MSETTPLLPAHTARSTRMSVPKIKHESKKTPKITKLKLGTFEGVFLPTTLNVLSILMFLRFGFIIGQMGIMGALLLLVMSYVIDVLTVLSVSAISTNGTVKGGGAYYMISRSLGPEFGGAIGIIFFIGQILNSSLNVVGFIEPLLVNFGKVDGDIMPILPVSYVWQVAYSTILLAVCTCVALVGSGLVSKTAFWLFIVLTLSTLSIPVSALLVKPGYPLSAPYEHLKYTGIAWSTFKENMWPHFTSGAAGSVQPPGVPETFKNLFGIFFPATAGIFAGASMSGELKNPSRSIPQGTLKGLVASFILYFLVIVSLGASTPRELLHSDIKIIQSVNMNGLIIIFGEVSTSLFSVIMGIVGAASMLNAIADDRIIPGLTLFSLAKKLPGGKRRAEIYSVIFTWAIAQVFLFADINQIATFITMAFLMTFLVTNLACFLLKLGSAPNFRPSFKYFSSRTAFTGGLVSVLAMYLVDGISATSVIIFLVFLIMMIHYSTPPLKFGDISQLLIYHQVRKYLLRLKLQMSVKYWRPQILLLCDNPRTSWNLIGFCNHLKKGGLYILGHVVLLTDEQNPDPAVSLEFTIDTFKEVQKQKGAWVKLRDMTKIKAFVQVAIGPSLPWGVRNVFLGSGLGGMRPNITVIGFYDFHKHGIDMPILPSDSQNLLLPTDDCRKEKKVSVNQWVQIVEDLVIMQATVAVAANFKVLQLPAFEGLSWFDEKTANVAGKKKYIDLYPIQMSSICLLEDGKSVLSTNFDTYTLILQLGSILSTVNEWKKTGHILRIIAFVESQGEEEDERKRLTDLLASLRIDAELKIVCFDDGSLSTYNFMVKGYNVTSSNRERFESISNVLRNDQWWANLCDARETMKDIEKLKSIKKRSSLKLKSISIGDDPDKKFSPVGITFSKSPNEAQLSNFSNNRRYTLSNLHEQGLSMSFNMKAQGGDQFFKYEDTVDSSSESDTDKETHSESMSGTTSEASSIAAPSENYTNPPPVPLILAPQKQGRYPEDRNKPSKHPMHHKLKLRYQNALGAVSSDQLSIRSSRSNLRPNFLAVKIPQSRIRDDEDDDGDEGENEDEENKPSISFVDDQNAEEDEDKRETKFVPGRPVNKQLDKASGGYFDLKFDKAKPNAGIRSPSIITNDGILQQLQTPQFLAQDEDGLEEVPSLASSIHEVTPAGRMLHSKDGDSPKNDMITQKQLQHELKNLTFNDLPAKGQHLILNELMKLNSKKDETAVIFSTLPAPIIGTHLDDEESFEYTNNLAIWLDDLPPVLLLNSQTVTVTTAL